MYNDIANQPFTLKAVMENLNRQVENLDIPTLLTKLYSPLVFTGCGTTYALGLSAASYFRHLGISATALPASEIKFYPDLLPPQGDCLVAVSRSGKTSETLWAVQTFRQKHRDGTIIAITADPQAELAGYADVLIDASPARDFSVVETCSFTGMLSAAQILATLICKDTHRKESLTKIPELFSRVLPEAQQYATKLMDEPFNRLFFLGGGPLYGLACQASFTIKECSANWVEAFHPLEFRHGPRTAATDSSIVILFLSDAHAREELKVVHEMSEQGARVLVIAEDVEQSEISHLDNVLKIGSGLDYWDRITLYLPLAQWLAYFWAIKQNKDPDHPQNLNAVTRL